MTRNRTASALVAATLLTVPALPSAEAAVPESDEPIQIALNNWTSQLVLSNVVGQLLERMGYHVEYLPADSQLQFIAMAEGDIDLQVEVWEAGNGAAFMEAVKTGGVVDAGTHTAITREDIWYPIHVEKLCPGLPDWKALNACAEIFAVPETKPMGRFVGPPADWVKHFGDRLSALKMDFVEVPVGQAATLWAELQAAYDRNEPIILFNWTPNFIESKFEGRFVEFPEYEPACHSDPAWGVNPDAIYDCGSPKDGYLKKAASSRMEGEWPAAYQFLRRVNFTNPQIAEAAALVDVDGMTPEEAATRWIENNESAWQAWMPTN